MIKNNYIPYILAIIVFFGLKCCDSCNNTSNESEYNYNETDESSFSNSNEIPSWVQGQWYTQTSFGPCYLEINGKSVTLDLAGDIETGHITHRQDNLLMVDYGNNDGTFLELDEYNHRIGIGQGIYVTKR